jgi:8-oxo-dGTP diphosphatase
VILPPAGGADLAPARPKVAVLAVTFRGDQVILVQRKNEPQKGSWGFPGGSVELGESLSDAARRELMEETGVTAEIIGHAEIVELREKDALGHFHHFVLIAMLCRYKSGDLTAGDDAADCRWVRVPDGFQEFNGVLADHVARVAKQALARGASPPPGVDSSAAPQVLRISDWKVGRSGR